MIFPMVNIPSEKRKYARLSVREPVHYCSWKEISNALTIDIGRGGLSFKTSHFMPVRTPLSLTVYVNERPLTVVGKTVWIRKMPHEDRYAVGFEFNELSTWALRNIINLESEID